MFARAIISSPHHFLHVKSSDRLIDLLSFFIFFSVDNHPSSPRKVSNSGIPGDDETLLLYVGRKKNV